MGEYQFYPNYYIWRQAYHYIYVGMAFTCSMACRKACFLAVAIYWIMDESSCCQADEKEVGLDDHLKVYVTLGSGVDKNGRKE